MFTDMAERKKNGLRACTQEDSLTHMSRRTGRSVHRQSRDGLSTPDQECVQRRKETETIGEAAGSYV